MKSKIKKMNLMKERIKEDMLAYKQMSLEMNAYLSQYQMVLHQ